MKNYLYGGIAVICIIVLAFAVVGFKHTFWPKPVPVTVPGQVVNLTQQQRDSLDAVWRGRVYLVKHGTTISRGKDTVTITVADTSEIQGLYSLIEAMQGQQPQIIHDTQLQTTPGRKWNLGLMLGGSAPLADLKAGEVHAGPSIDKGRHNITPFVRYDIDNKWGGGLNYTIKIFK
jgi:hypothetical protein